MAIERQDPTENQEPPESAGMADEGSETVDIPMSITGDQPPANVGDVILLEVVSVNQDAGTYSVEYAEPDMPQMKGSNGVASRIGQKMKGM